MVRLSFCLAGHPPGASAFPGMCFYVRNIEDFRLRCTVAPRPEFLDNGEVTGANLAMWWELVIANRIVYSGWWQPVIVIE